MAQYPSVNSQLIRCAIYPIYGKTSKTSYTLNYHERPGSNVRHIATLHLAGKWKAESQQNPKVR